MIEIYQEYLQLLFEFFHYIQKAQILTSLSPFLFRLNFLGTENDTVYNLIEDEVDKQLLFLALRNLNEREKERFGCCMLGNPGTGSVTSMLTMIYV